MSGTHTSALDRYLCFRIANDEFAMPLLSVKQVIGMPEVTPVPQVPSYFVGIMNLRGQVISVIDLRQKLGIKATDNQDKSVIIFDLDSHSIGLVVDEVHSVLSPEQNHMSPPPDLGRTPASDYITAVYRREDRLILVMDMMRVLSKEDRNAAMKAAA